uniref:M144 protein n=1 Tax=Murid herpesvirus 1 TaxID=10366 RepID=Q1XE10_MUHV1|nr:m144 protein [Murid betaherpesvirus 1]
MRALALICVVWVCWRESCARHGTEDSSDSGLRYAYTLVVDSTKNTRRCFGTGHVDGEAFVGHSDNETHGIGRWVNASHVEEENRGFVKQCQELQAELDKMQNNSKVIGIKTVQLDVGCTSKIEKHYAYDGNETEDDMVTSTNERDRDCQKKLSEYRRLVLASAVSPQLEVERRSSGRDGGMRLRCFARDYYPANLEIRWWKDDGGGGALAKAAQQHNPNPLPSGNGLYQKHIDVYVDGGLEHVYSCRVKGIATKLELQIVRWKGYARGAGNSVVLLALFIPASVMAAVVVGSVLIRKKSKEQRKTRRRFGRRSGHESKRPSYQVKRRAEPPCDLPMTIWFRGDNVMSTQVEACPAYAVTMSARELSDAWSNGDGPIVTVPDPSI